ncbi:MAG TPA: DUF1761 domain-containing protein [Phycisphaerae bacterium]|jgi:hypothetical protein
MPTFDLAKINWLAVFTAALATFFLGAVWYQALFGNLWKRLHGYTHEQLRAMQAKRPPLVFFGGMIGAYLLLAFVMALLVTAFNVTGIAGGLALGLLLWLGPTSAVAFTGWLAADKAIGTYGLDAAYQFVYMAMIGVILAVWR